MYTVTKDRPLATTVTGSWPRPTWFDKSMWGRPLSALHDGRRLPRAVHRRAHRVHRRSGARRARHPHAGRLLPRRRPGRALVAPLPAAALARADGRQAPDHDDQERPAHLSARHAAARDLHELALAARRGQGRAEPRQPARVRQDLPPRAGAHAQAGQVRHRLGAGHGAVPRRPHGRLRPGRQAPAGLGHGDGHQPGAARGRGGRAARSCRSRSRRSTSWRRTTPSRRSGSTS